MIKGKTIRKIIGVLGVLIILIPLSGFSSFWKETMTIIFGALVVILVIYKPMVVEVLRLREELREERGDDDEEDGMDWRKKLRIDRFHPKKLVKFPRRRKKVETFDEQAIMTDEGVYDE